MKMKIGRVESAAATPATSPRYVELIRVSTAAQIERDTPEAQRRALDRMRETRPGVPVKRIELPENVSGAADVSHRRDLQELAALSVAKAYDELRVVAVDRLTRHADPRERMAVYGFVLDAGAVIVDTSGHVIDPQNEIGEIDFYLQSFFASRERMKIQARTMAGKERLARAGRLVQGQPPFARTFNKTTGEWGIDPDRAKTYRRMFELCLTGRSLNEIAEQLNREGAVSTRGKAWTGSNVCKLLREPAAFGRYTARPGVTFEIPAIVDEATFKAADAKLRKNNSLSGPKPTVAALLRKLAVCGVCGSPMYLQLGGGGQRIRYYYCSAKDPACLRYHRVRETDERVIRGLQKWLREHSHRWFERPVSDADARAELNEQVSGAKREMKDLDRQEEKLARLARKGLISDAVATRQLAEVVRDRNAAKARISDAEAQLAAGVRAVEDADAMREHVEFFRQMADEMAYGDWVKFAACLFPRGAIKFFPDGNIDLKGWLPPEPPAGPAPSGDGNPPSASRKR